MEVTMSKSAAIAGALSGLVFGASALWPALAVEATAPPNFAPDSIVGWIAVPGGFKPPGSGPGPIVNDPAHPQIVNLLPNYPPSGRIQGGQPTFPIADLTNPILQPWAREELRKRNERILSGKTGYSRQASCWPIGVPGFLLHGVQPVYFIQSAKEVIMVWQEGLSDPPRLSERAPFGETRAVMVRRIRRPLRRRYSGCRYHRHERPDLDRQLP